MSHSVRKGMKARARHTFRGHYWLIVVICLVAAFIGAEYESTLWAESYETQTPISQEVSAERLEGVLGRIASGDEAGARAEVADNEQAIRDGDTVAMLGRSRGVFASLLNAVSSGSILFTMADAIQSIVRSHSVAIALLVVVSFVVYALFWLFVQQVYPIVARRMVLESRIYDKVPLRRFLYPVQTRMWTRMAWVMLVRGVYLFLWSLTVIGGVIKSYSYFMVPYIMAENPTLKANEAIGLSRRMMRGHKWECFVSDLSFLGWRILDMVTFGLVGVFWLNGYRTAFFAEYYARLRSEAKAGGLEGADGLCDDALFAKPDPGLVRGVYVDAVRAVNDVHGDVRAPRPAGFSGFIAMWFGVTFRNDAVVNAWQRHQARLDAVREEKDILSLRTYPERLAPARMEFRAGTVSGPGATRCYTLLNLVLMFFIFCFVGWLWEVVLAFITEGMFVNRGTLHGPWLPIYGSGGVAILVLLKRLRNRPLLEFVAAMVLCGAIEYFSSWYLEVTHDGQRWWDYTGYFMNINGRICAEGLLTFGLGGLAIVYLLAPLLDDLLNRVDVRTLTVVAVLLLVVYCADLVYSSRVPNTGAGITDYRGSDAVSMGVGDVRPPDAVPVIPDRL